MTKNAYVSVKLIDDDLVNLTMQMARWISLNRCRNEAENSLILGGKFQDFLDKYCLDKDAVYALDTDIRSCSLKIELAVFNIPPFHSGAKVDEVLESELATIEFLMSSYPKLAIVVSKDDYRIVFDQLRIKLDDSEKIIFRELSKVLLEHLRQKAEKVLSEYRNSSSQQNQLEY